MAGESDSSDFEAEEIALLRASSQLPSPAELQAYEEISPGLADRLIRIIELQQRMVREEIEEHERARRTAYFAKIFGRVLLFIAVLATFSTAVFLVERGFRGSAYVLASISVLPLLWLVMSTLLWKSVGEIWPFKRGRDGDRNE